MRYTGTQARGIRLPIINSGDPLAEIVAGYVIKASKAEGFTIRASDVVGITEAIVSKAQGNYASLDQLASDIRSKYPDGQVGVVFPIMSRNRFVNILKGITMGADEVFVLLSYPSDEIGNPIMDISNFDEINDRLKELPQPIPADKFREVAGDFRHPFTEVDYISLYESLGAKVYFSNDPRSILNLTDHALAADVHTRFVTRDRLKKAGAKTVFTLSDILNKPPVSGEFTGFNPQYGILGSNISSNNVLKLFPRECDDFVLDVQRQFELKCGVRPEVMVYGDGAFKDPVCGIWELADPVVSPAFTAGIRGRPFEIKMKMVVDTKLSTLSGAEREQAVKDIIRDSKAGERSVGYDQEGTTPRQYSDLLGSLCDLMGGSGDKGTPVVVIQGYFDSYADA